MWGDRTALHNLEFEATPKEKIFAATGEKNLE
jgi:hypothetical protein